ncbi:AAA family ATPase [Clostridium paraputrificum]|uniref:AAA family ATPase n=1 Tax=Clostridium paraputrificum TaxID=29363 RepID=UPI0018987C23|nr:AAA family ATPase [Clostridium paraputrificum]MDB2123141.1 AAA family ATPase [Clostridium paraputrificum]
MIIKELKIDSFGGVENKIIHLSKGLNLVYGENEAGKSTIEEFIKVMLYGFPQKRGKSDGDRKRYLPFKGGGIRGELTLEQDGREYIIKRMFALTKKEDTCEVLDALTGEVARNINIEEPGKSFLGVNRSTFEKTLFISQLGVSFGKDKEEEIMERITSLFGCAEEEVPAAKALSKIEGIKKELTTSRGVGALDGLKKKYSSLLEERYEGYNIAEQNLNWENELLLEKEKRKTLNDEITKLELYKKYLKKVKLHKEYKDISEYLKKSEELKREERALGNLIDEDFIDDLKEDNRLYLGLIDKREELKEVVEEIKGQFNYNKEELDKYKFLEMFDDNIKEKLINLKYEQQNLEAKISSMKALEESLAEDEGELLKRRAVMKNLHEMREYIEEIEEVLSSYEDKLKEIKDILQQNNIPKNLDIKLKKSMSNMYLGGILGGIGIVLSFFGIPLMILGILLICLGAFLGVKGFTEGNTIKGKKNASKMVEALTKEIDSIELSLDRYMEKVDAKDYGDLITAIRRFNSYKEYEERLLLRIEEKKKMINEEGLLQDKNRYKKNCEMISSIERLSSSKDLDEVLEKVNIFESLSITKEKLEEDLNIKTELLNELSSNIEVQEEKLREKLKTMDLDLGNLLDIELYIKEYKEKLKKRAEIHSNILSIEETYKVLLKDRNIAEIKEELKSIVNDENEYSFESEDEIEREEKKKSRELIDCEKRIKDLENNIATRLIGKRDLVKIEEEIQTVEGEVRKGDKKVKALDIAMETLKESFNEIRREVGPEINRRILDNFKKLSLNKYEDVKLGDNYEMLVRDKDNLFKGNYLSNGAYDQLYLSLRLAFIDMLFSHEECPIILDDAFIQYDDTRRKKAIELIYNKIKGQGIIFTCQQKEKEILDEICCKYNLISL